MRLAVAAAALLHAGAVGLLLALGAPRDLARAPEEGAGVAIIFDAGSDAEAAGDHPAAAWQEAAAPQADAREEDAVREELPAAGDVSDAPPPAPTPAALADAAQPLPLPPPPPPEPPPAPAATARPRPPADPVRNTAPRSATQRDMSGGQGGEAQVALASGGTQATAVDRLASITHRVDPVVPAEARRARLQGTVVLAVTVSSDGVPTAVDVARSSGHLLLDRAAQEALWQWRFDPARRAGVPVEERVAIPVTFRIVD